MLRNFRGAMDSSPKSIFVKEKNRRLPHPDLAPTNGERPHFVRPLADFCSVVKLTVTLLNHDRVWRGLLLVPVGSYMQKTLAIGR